LFLLGALVRATGSGMGCPDWPKCFGLYAPPTCECQLPKNYEQVFQEKRHKKVAKFLKTLRAFGLNEKADLIETDKNLYVQEKFDPTKAWIEYINRLFGVLAGLFAVMFIALSFLNKSLKNTRLWVSLGFVMLILNAWLGSIVVTTNLLPGIVSLHFLFSFLCLFGFINAIQKAMPVLPMHNQEKYKVWLLLWLVIFVEVILGTWSREQVDMLRSSSTLYLNGNSNEMLNYMGMDWLFIIHRYVPGVILIYALMKYFKSSQILPKFKNHWFWITLICFMQICLGAVHIVYVVPKWTQIAHVVLGSGLLTYSFLVLLSFKKEKI
jgi:cytochrome c oxidase assembly protein subunit 15